MLEALSEGCGVGVSSLFGAWLQAKCKITFRSRIIHRPVGRGGQIKEP